MGAFVMVGPDSTGAREFDRSVPSAARAYDYYLGGSHNFEADRDFAERILRIMPQVRGVVTANRAFLRRAVHHLLRQGISQFLDLGSGIPTAGNVHEIARSYVPDARVVYVDREPVACAHAEELLAGDPNAAIIQADVRHPDSILLHPATRELLDFDRPLGLLMVGVLLFIGPRDDPAGLVAAYRGRLAPGSYFAASHITGDDVPPEGRRDLAALVAAYAGVDEHIYVRDLAEFSSWFTGMEIVPPGVVRLADWRPDGPVDPADPAHLFGYGGVGREI